MYNSNEEQEIGQDGGGDEEQGRKSTNFESRVGRHSRVRQNVDGKFHAQLAVVANITDKVFTSRTIKGNKNYILEKYSWLHTSVKLCLRLGHAVVVGLIGT